MLQLTWSQCRESFWWHNVLCFLNMVHHMPIRFHTVAHHIKDETSIFWSWPMGASILGTNWSTERCWSILGNQTHIPHICSDHIQSAFHNMFGALGIGDFGLYKNSPIFGKLLLWCIEKGATGVLQSSIIQIVYTDIKETVCMTSTRVQLAETSTLWFYK